MKKVKIFSLIAILFATITGCETTEPVVFTGSAVKFSTLQFSESVPRTGLTLNVPISATEISTVERRIPVNVLDATAESELTVSEGIIPANSFTGSIVVTIPFAGIGGSDGDLRTATLELASGADYEVFAGKAKIDYFRAITCNDVTFTINADRFGSETEFFILNSANQEVYRMPAGVLVDVAATAPRSTYTANFTLPDGCYTAVHTDQFGDGNAPDGNYSITCSIATYALAGPYSVSEQRTPFCVNQ